MIFLASIGNTNLTCGLYHGELLAADRFPIAQLSQPADVKRFFRSLFQKLQSSQSKIKGAVLSSVVPAKTPLLQEGVKTCIFPQPLLVTGQTSWAFDRSAYDGLLGTDRLLCCQAALQKYEPPFVVIDCGTATTLNVMDSSGAFLGGVILPGILTGMQALESKTAQLHAAALSAPKSVIGKNTAQCLASGAIYGAAAQLEGLVGRIQREIHRTVAVVLTGGNAEVIMPHLAFRAQLEPDLLLEGLAQKYQEYETGLQGKEDSL